MLAEFIRSLKVAEVVVKTSTGNVTHLNEGVVVVRKDSGAATTVTLKNQPSYIQGFFVFVMDDKGDAATNNVTVVASSGNISGASSYVIRENYGAAVFMWNGTSWNVVATFKDQSSTAIGAGAAAGSGVSAVEYGNAALHKTVLTLTAASIPVVSVTTGAGIGGLKIYDFPAGHIQIQGVTASLTVSVPTADQADYTDNTPEGDIGLGTVIITDPTAFSTDPTDDDIAAGVAIAMTAFSDALTLATTTAAAFDGTSTAVDLNLNALIDGADIDNDVTTSLEVTGTITFHWVNLGDL